MKMSKAEKKLAKLAIKAAKIAKKANKEAISIGLNAREYDGYYYVSIYMHNSNCDIIHRKSTRECKEVE